MKWAVDEHGKRITATKGARAFEPGSLWPVIAKCGSIVEHHWACTPGATPDPWSEPEGPWHRAWKERLVPDSHQEYTFVGGPAGYHRADAIGKGGIVVEFQHSPISPEEIAAREDFYLTRSTGLVWVIDAKGFRLSEWVAYSGVLNCRWKHPKKSWWEAHCPMFWDFGDGTMLEVLSIERDIPCTVYGIRIERAEFVARFGVPKDVAEEPNPQPSGLTRQAMRAELDDRLQHLMALHQGHLADLARREAERRAAAEREASLRAAKAEDEIDAFLDAPVKAVQKALDDLLDPIDPDERDAYLDDWLDAFEGACNSGLVGRHGVKAIADGIDRKIGSRPGDSKRPRK